jgi:hypothetical protein
MDGLRFRCVIQLQWPTCTFCELRIQAWVASVMNVQVCDMRARVSSPSAESISL